MIVHIEVQVSAVDRDGWMCQEPTGIYSVMRSDGSRRDVNVVQLIGLLKDQPCSAVAACCPVCGVAGVPIHGNEDGTNHICPDGCPSFRIEKD